MAKEKKDKVLYKHYVPDVRVVSEWYKQYSFILVETMEQLKDIFSTCEEGKYFMAFDTETSSLCPETGTIVGYSFSLDGKSAYYVAVDHYVGDFNLGKESLDFIYAKMCSANKVIMYNAKFDMRMMEYYGFKETIHSGRLDYVYYDMSKVKYFDVANPVWLSDTNIKMPSLKDSALKFLGYKMQTYAEVSDGVENFYYIDPRECFFYASADALCTYLLVGATMKYFNESGMAGIVDNAVIYPLMKYEQEKVYLDSTALGMELNTCKEQVDALEKGIYEDVGYVFNLNSPVQVSTAFSKLGIDTGSRTKSGYMSTGIELLSNLPKDIKLKFPALDKFIKYKTTFKFMSSYVKVLYEISLDKGYVRCNYKTQTVPTGRLASGKDTKNPFFSAFNVQSSPKPHPMFYYALDMGDRTLYSKKDNIIMGYKFIPVKYSEDGKLIDGNSLYDNFMYIVEGANPNENVRRAFLPHNSPNSDENEWIFCSIDFSGQELRLAANFSREPVWISAFKSGGDIHKNCYSLDTEILTPEGFKTYDQIGFDDLIAQYNDDINKVEWVRAGHIYWNETDVMYNFRGRNTDLMVTPNHRMWTRGRDNWYIHKAEKLYNRKSFDTICSPDILEDKTSLEYVDIEPSTHSDGMRIPIRDFVEMIGYVLTDDGTCMGSAGSKEVYMSQSEVKGDVLKKIQELNIRLGNLFKEDIEECEGRVGYIDGREVICRGNFHRFGVCRARLFDFIVDNFGGLLKKDRRLPEWFKKLPNDLLEIFIQTLVDCDGYTDRREGRNCRDVIFQSKQFRDDVQVLCMKLGYSTNAKDIVYDSGVVMYNLAMVSNKRVVIVSNKNTEIIKYDEKVKSFCFSVPSGLLVVRRNGKISVCGNTAYSIWGEANYDKEKRKMAKGANFSVIYGAQAISFVGEGRTQERPMGMSLIEAEEFYDNYKKGLPTLFAYQERLIRSSRKKGIVSTFFGRPRRVKFYFENNQWGFGSRTVLNSPIQGCLPYDTKILTDKGYIPIGRLFDEYTADLGDPYTPLNALGVNPSTDEGFRSKYKVWNGERWCDFHPVYKGMDSIWELELSNGQKFKMDSRHKVKVFAEDSIVWKNTKDLCEGDILCFSKLASYDVGEYVNSVVGECSLSSSSYRTDMVFDRDDIRILAYIFGSVLGDGHIELEKKSLSMTFGKTKYSNIPIFKKFFSKFGIKCTIRTKTHTLPLGRVSERKMFEVKCKPLVVAIQKLTGLDCSQNCYTKRIPAKVYTLDRELRGLIIKGFYDTDGSKDSVSFHLANELLLRDFQLLLRLQGFSSHLFKNGVNVGKATVSKDWQLNIHHPKAFKRFLNECSLFSKSVFNSFGGNHKSILPYHHSVFESVEGDKSIKNLGESLYVASRGLSHRGRVCWLSTFRRLLSKINPKHSWEDYDFYKISNISSLGYEEDTYTLMVDDEKHQFDSEGIISKNTAGDVLKIVMCKLWKEVLNNPKYRNDVMFKSTVHDEINYGIRTERLLEIARVLENTMYFSVKEWEVPLTVEVSFGWNWGSLFDFVWDDENKIYKPKGD